MRLAPSVVSRHTQTHTHTNTPKHTITHTHTHTRLAVFSLQFAQTQACVTFFHRVCRWRSWQNVDEFEVSLQFLARRWPSWRHWTLENSIKD